MKNEAHRAGSPERGPSKPDNEPAVPEDGKSDEKTQGAVSDTEGFFRDMDKK